MPSSMTDMHSEEKIANLAAEIALDGYRGPGTKQFESKPELAALVNAGSELWFDTGDKDAAKKVWAKEMQGLTTNNTLINQVIQTGSLDESIRTIGDRLKSARPDMSLQDIVIEVAFILNAKIALSLIETFGSKVSVELHPDLSDNWEATVAFGKRYFAICPDRFIIKVPMTPDGFLAVRRLSDENIPVNYTLGFSVRQNYFASVFSRPAYVNVFLGRLGNLLSENKLGTGDNIGERVTLGSQEAIAALRSSHGVPTRQIAASLRAGHQVASLAGVDVHTIPPKVAQEYLDSNPDLSSIRLHKSDEFPVSLGNDDVSAKIPVLWEVSDRFKAFTEAAAAKATQMKSGLEIIEMSKEHGVGDFFRHWAVEEQLEIRQGGKIPDFHRWHELAAADDLMSQAALQSFATDQGELDSRIARLIS